MANVAEFVWCDSRNYTASRQGNRILKIAKHYAGIEAQIEVFSQLVADIRR